MKYLNLKNKNGLLWLVFCLGFVIAMQYFVPRDETLNQQQYPTGFLEILDAKGHAIEKHVGKSDDYLFNRIQSEDISAASTFNSMAEAEASIRATLLNRGSLVTAWLNTEKSNKKVFYSAFDKPVGLVLKRGWNAPRAGNQVRVVLIRDHTYDTGFFILTAYPSHR